MKLYQENSLTPQAPTVEAVASAVGSLLLAKGYSLLLTGAQTCELLGYSDRRTLKDRINAGLLPAPNAKGEFSLIEIVMASYGFSARKKFPLTPKLESQVERIRKNLHKNLPAQVG